MGFRSLERWKEVPGYHGAYWVSSHGQVRGHSFQLMKQRSDHNGYLTINLKFRGTAWTTKVHRLVLMAFVGLSDIQVNHKDGNRKNNNLHNLEYVTCLQNNRHAWKRGRKPIVGEDHYNSRLTIEDVVKIRQLRGQLSQSKIGKLFRITQTAVHAIQSRRIWKDVT